LILVLHAFQKKAQKTRKARSAATRAGRRVELAVVGANLKIDRATRLADREGCGHGRDSIVS
jgi:hypothetical protein